MSRAKALRSRRKSGWIWFTSPLYFLLVMASPGCDRIQQCTCRHGGGASTTDCIEAKERLFHVVMVLLGMIQCARQKGSRSEGDRRWPCGSLPSGAAWHIGMVRLTFSKQLCICSRVCLRSSEAPWLMTCSR
jgi:hypothetical protein